MIATRLRLRDFRSYAAADVALGDGLTVVHGRNGAGKTNLLEALYFGCTGRSCRTSNEREVVRFDAQVARVEVDLRDDEGAEHALSVGFEPGRGQAHAGRRRERRAHRRAVAPADLRLPPRPPRARQGPAGAAPLARRPGRRGDVARRARRRAARTGRRSRSATPCSRACAAAGRRRARCRRGTPSSPATASRCATTAPPRSTCSPSASARSPRRWASASGAELRYKPRSRAADAAGLAAELAEHTASDLERGFTGHGPHRDDLGLLRAGRELRAYGSQGEQRLALLALLLAEREALAATRRAVPLMLLDDVMSELDPDRRALLARDARRARGRASSRRPTSRTCRVPARRRSCASPSRDGAVLQDAVPA